MNIKTVQRVNRLNYLGIIYDKELTFKEHINYKANNCTKLISSLYNATKLNCGLNHKALNDIHIRNFTNTHVRPSRMAKSMKIESYESKLIRVKKIKNIKMTKAYRTVSNESFCLLTGVTHIAIKKEITQLYQLRKGNTNKEANVDTNTGVKHWQYPTNRITIILEENKERSQIQIFTDGSWSEKGVGACGHHIKSLHCRFYKRCTNIQAQQLVTLTALKYTDSMETRERIATVYTDSQMTLDCLHNSNINTYVIEEIRKKLNEITNRN